MSRYKVHLGRLPNGLTVLSHEMRHMASVCVGMWVAAGGRHESEAVNGVSHFIEHMLFKGTTHRTPRQISEAVEGVGGYMNAFTGEENTCFFAKGPATRLGGILNVIADMLLNSRFDPADIVKERSLIREELAMYKDQPQSWVHEILNDTLWPNQPLGRSLTGSEESLARIRRTTLLDFMQRHYHGGSIVLVAAGAVSHEELMSCVRREFQHLRPGKRIAWEPSVNAQSEPRIRLQRRKTEQTQLALGFRGVSRHSPLRHAVRLLHTLLGENMSSRLFQVVREDRGLVYDIHSSCTFFDDTGDLVISAGLDEARAASTLRLITAELRRLAKSPPEATELERARDYAISQFDMSLEGTEPHMTWLGEQFLAHGSIPSPAKARDEVAAVTPAQVRAAAAALFTPANANLAVVGGVTDPKPLRKILDAI